MPELMTKEMFAKRLTELRMQKNISSREMSLSLGQSPGYINNIETGKAKPSLDGLFYICEFLGITPSEFFDTQSPNPSKLDSIVKDMKKLNDKQLDIIDSLVKDMIKH